MTQSGVDPEESKFQGWIGKNLKQSWLKFSILIILSLFSAGLQLFNPWPLKILIDSVFGQIPPPWPLNLFFAEKTIQLLAAVAFIYFATFFLEGILTITYLYVSTKFTNQKSLKLKNDFFSKILNMPLYTKRKFHGGDYVYRLNEETDSVPDIVFNNFTSIFEGVITIVAALVILTILNWQLALVGLLVVPLLYFSIKFFTPRIESTSTGVEMAGSETYDYSSEAIGNVEIVQAFNGQEFQEERYNDIIKKRMQLSLKLNMFSGAFDFTNNIFTGVAISVVLFVGGYYVFNNKLTLGELIIFINYMNYFYQPLQEVVSNVASYKTMRAAARRVFAILNDNSEQEQENLNKGSFVSPAQGKIIFKDVTVRYNKRLILDKVNFEILPGQKVAFIGPSGSGKSTILNLLMRFSEADSGFIYLDGHEIRSIELGSLRNQFALVTQEPILFSGTIHENIAFAKPIQHDMQEIENAANAANAAEFIEKLPDKFESNIGEVGDSLSGGQKQRIAIARAFLKNAPILIMDEPTSAQDQESETKILSAITSVMEGKTALISTHQMSLLRQMDVVYVVEDTKVTNINAYGGLDQSMYHLMAKPAAD